MDKLQQGSINPRFRGDDKFENGFPMEFTPYLIRGGNDHSGNRLNRQIYRASKYI